METVLIAGGTGLIGNKLTEMLQESGYEVNYLSRKKNIPSTVKTFQWDVKKGFIETGAIDSADHIIHLSGANVGEHRWTKSFKEEIVNSRVNSSHLLFESLKKIPNHVQTVVAASAIGYYGDHGDEWLFEDAPAALDFWGITCATWEDAVQQIASLNKRVVMIRTGIVLSDAGGALPPLVRPIRLGISPVFGNGKQWYPWIHIADLCRMYLFAIQNNNLQGVYNGVAPNPERFSELMDAVAKVLHRRKIKVPVPISILKLVMGEFVETLAFSMRCSSKKIEATGFQFQYPELKEALQDLLKK